MQQCLFQLYIVTMLFRILHSWPVWDRFDVRQLIYTSTEKAEFLLALIANDNSELAAELLADMDASDVATLVASMDASDAAQILVGMNASDVATLVASMDASDAAPILADMDASDAATLVASMDASDATPILAGMDASDAANIIANISDHALAATLEDAGAGSDLASEDATSIQDINAMDDAAAGFTADQMSAIPGEAAIQILAGMDPTDAATLLLTWQVENLPAWLRLSLYSTFNSIRDNNDQDTADIFSAVISMANNPENIPEIAQYIQTINDSDQFAWDWGIIGPCKV